MKKCISILASCAMASAIAAEVVSRADIRDIRPKGYVASRMDVCVRNHVAATDPLYFTSVFRAKTEDRLWQSEFWGKYMHAAVPFMDYADDAALRAKVAASVRDVLAAQEPGGYVGNYREDARYRKGNWDVWGTKYTLLGLLFYHQATGDKSALDGAERLAAYLMNEVGPGKRAMHETGNFRGMPSCSVLEPVVWLYRATGKKVYLDYANYIRDEMDADDGARLLKDADKAVFDRVTDGSAWGATSLKAYEMMSCYQGMLDLYDAIGEKRLFDAALKAARSIAESEVNIVGGAASCERWYDGAKRETDVYNRQNETCVVTTWMRLCEKLYFETGDSFWIDQIEKTLFNIYLATMRVDGGEFSQYCPLAGTRGPGEDHSRMHTNCCNANGPRGFLVWIETLLAGSGDTLALNHFASGTFAAEIPALGKKAVYDVYTRYPEMGLVELTCRNPEPMEYTLRIRVPSWCQRLDARVNRGEVVSCDNPRGESKYLDIRRVWKEGDYVDFTAQFDVRAHYKNGYVAFTRGPVVLARDLRFGDGDIGEVLRPDFARAGSMQSDGSSDAPAVRFERVRAGSDFWMAFAAALPTGTHSESTRDWLPEMVHFCDFASAGLTWDRKSAYRVWLPMLKFETSR